MTIEIYRKRYVAGVAVVDDTPEIVWHDVSCIEVLPKYIYGSINGEQLTIKTDHYNYQYIII